MDTTIEALEITLKTTTDPLERIETLSRLAFFTTDLDLDKACTYIEKLDELIQDNALNPITKQIGSAWWHFNMGWIHLRRSEHNLALKKFQDSKTIFKKLNHARGKRETENGLGVTYLQMAHFDKALASFLKALGHNEENLELFFLSGILNNLGVVYIELGDFKEAKKYLEQSYEASSKIGDLRHQAAALDNQSNTYFRLGDHKKALSCALESIRLSRVVGTKVFEAESLNSAGDAYMALGKLENAMSHYKMALKLAEKIGHSYEKVEAMVRIGILHLEMGNTQAAGKSLYAALSLARQTDATRLEYQIYKALSELNELLGNQKLALQYFKFFHDIRQEVFSLQADWRLKSLRVLHQVETNENLRLVNAKLQDRLREIESLQHQLEEQATRDPLTGLYNRRHLDETLKKELARQAREGGALSLVMMDIDLFKEVNDQFGHQAGDEVLIALGKLLRDHTRASDTVYRYGGDEFIVALPGAEPQEALQRGIEWRKDFAELIFSFPQETLRPSISIGIASFPQNATTLDSLFRAADDALYTSKIHRNRVTLSEKELA